jgi:hypothetical protein
MKFQNCELLGLQSYKQALAEWAIFLLLFPWIFFLANSDWSQHKMYIYMK